MKLIVFKTFVLSLSQYCLGPLGGLDLDELRVREEFFVCDMDALVLKACRWILRVADGGGCGGMFLRVMLGSSMHSTAGRGGTGRSDFHFLT